MIRKKSKEFWPSTQDPEARYDKRGPATNTDKLDLASRQDGWTYSTEDHGGIEGTTVFYLTKKQACTLHSKQ